MRLPLKELLRSYLFPFLKPSAMSDLHPKLKLRPNDSYPVRHCLDSLTQNRDYTHLRATSISLYKHENISQYEFLLVTVVDCSTAETFHLLIERVPGEAFEEGAPRRSVVSDPADIAVGAPTTIVVNDPAPAINSPQFADAGVDTSSKAPLHDNRFTPIPTSLQTPPTYPPEASTSALVEFNPSSSQQSSPVQVPAASFFSTSLGQLHSIPGLFKSRVKHCVAVDTVKWVLGEPKQGESWIKIGSLTFPASPELYLCDVVNLTLVVHDAHPAYSLLDKNRYFYAGTLVELLERTFDIEIIVCENLPPHLRQGAWFNFRRTYRKNTSGYEVEAERLKKAFFSRAEGFKEMLDAAAEEEAQTQRDFKMLKDQNVQYQARQAELEEEVTRLRAQSSVARGA